MITHNIGFYEEISKLSLNYHQISSNTHLISSAESWDTFSYFCSEQISVALCTSRLYPPPPWGRGYRGHSGALEPEFNL